MVEYLSSVTLRDLVEQQSGRGIVIQDMRHKKTKLDSSKPEKQAAATVAAKKEVAPKPPLINSVFNLAQQS